MKFAYSILLGEHVAAREAGYSDAAAFYLVCPSCKDPVIKVERDIEKDISHFFSHYRAVPGVSDCELRVAGILPEVRARTDALGRGQSLKIFLGVFRDLLEMARFHPEKWAEASKRPGIHRLAELLDRRFLNGAILQERELEELLNDHARFGDFEDLRQTTGLTMSFRRRLARDIVAHLRAPHAGRSRRAAMMFAATQAIVSLADQSGPDAGSVRPHAAKTLLELDEEALKKWVSKMAPQDAEHKELVEVETFALRALTFAMLTTPVTPILENVRNGRHPLFEVHSMDMPNVRPDESAS